MIYLLDTNVVSEARRERPDPVVMRWLGGVDDMALRISVLTLGEIAKGVALRAKRDPTGVAQLQDWLAAIRLHYADRLVPIGAETAEAWGTLTAARSLPVIDGLLAATAIVHDMTLVTRNSKDFADTGARLLDPWQA